MNHALTQLQPYPFEKLRALLGSVKPAADKRAIALSIGEPKHRSPAFVAEAFVDTALPVRAVGWKGERNNV